jgi:hypothetical protein
VGADIQSELACEHMCSILSLTGENATTAVGVGDSTAGVDAELSWRQAVVTDAVLAIAQLANLAGGTTGGGEVEAAAVTAANESVGASSEGSKSDEVLHHDCCSANVEGVVS